MPESDKAASKKLPLQAPVAVGKAPVGADTQPGEAGKGLPMPHERDESVGATADKPRAVIEQARKDLESGQMDTDMRASGGLDDSRRKEAAAGKR